MRKIKEFKLPGGGYRLHSDGGFKLSYTPMPKVIRRICSMLRLNRRKSANG